MHDVLSYLKKEEMKEEENKNQWRKYEMSFKDGKL